MKHLKVLASVFVLAGALGVANAQGQTKNPREDEKVKKLLEDFNEFFKGAPESQTEIPVNQIPVGRKMNNVTPVANKDAKDKVDETEKLGQQGLYRDKNGAIRRMTDGLPVKDSGIRAVKAVTDIIFENVDTTVLFSARTYENAATAGGRSSGSPGFGRANKISYQSPRQGFWGKTRGLKEDAWLVAQIAVPIIAGAWTWNRTKAWGKRENLGWLLSPLIAGGASALVSILALSVMNGSLIRRFFGKDKDGKDKNRKGLGLGFIAGALALGALKALSVPLPFIGMAAIMLMSLSKGSGQVRARQMAAKSREDMLIV